MENIKKPSLPQKPKEIRLNSPLFKKSKNEKFMGNEESVFIEVEDQINNEINSLISELEQLRNRSLEELALERELFKKRECEWQQRGIEYSDFLDKNIQLDIKRNSLANLQMSHINTISKNMIKHRREKPRAPYILFSCRKESIVSGIEQSKLTIHPIDHGVISFPEVRIKDWKSMPETVAIDSDSNNIYFSDPNNMCVRGYDMEGGYVGEVGLLSNGMVTPSSIAILRGELFVSDLELGCISKFNLRKEGEFVKKTRKIVSIKSPIAIAFNEKEELYVLDQLERKLTVLDTNLEFIRGYNLKIEETALPLDMKIRAGKIYVMLEKEIIWFEEPADECPTKTLKVTYNYLNIPTTYSNQHFCIDEEGNIIRTEANGQLIINAPDGREIKRTSFDSENETVSNLTGVCVIKKGYFIVAVTNKESILHIVANH